MASLSRKKKNILERTKDKIRYANLDNDHKVQKQYKKYKKSTKGCSQLTKEQYYDVNHPESKKNTKTRYYRT